MKNFSRAPDGSLERKKRKLTEHHGERKEKKRNVSQAAAVHVLSVRSVQKNIHSFNLISSCFISPSASLSFLLLSSCHFLSLLSAFGCTDHVTRPSLLCIAFAVTYRVKLLLPAHPALNGYVIVVINIAIRRFR